MGFSHFYRAATVFAVIGALLLPQLHSEDDDSEAVVLAKRAVALHGEKKYRESLKVADEVLKRGFKNHDFFLVVGDSLMRLQNYQQAHGAFNAALELDLVSRVALRGRLTAALKSDFGDSAVDAAKRLIDLGEDEYLRRGRGLLLVDRPIDAISDFQYVLMKSKPGGSNRIDAYFQRGRALENLGAFDLAIADFDRALAIRELPLIHRRRGEALSEMENHEDAIAAFTRVIELAEDEDVLLYRGREYSRAKMYNKAIADFKRAAEVAPDDAETQKNSRANIALMEKQREKGASAEGPKPDPDKAAMDALDFSDPEATRKQIEAVLARNSESVSGLWALANYHQLGGRAEQAFEAIFKAAEIDRDNPAILEEFAMTAVQVNQKTHAVQGVSRAIAKGSTQAYAGRASLFVANGLAGVALMDIEAALKMSAENPALHFVHGVSLLEQEDADPKRSAAAFAKAKVLGYKGERLYRAQTYQKLDRFAEAIADFTHDLERKPQSAGLLVQRALCYRRLRQYDAALADFRAAAKSAKPGSAQRQLALESIKALEAVLEAQKAQN